MRDDIPRYFNYVDGIGNPRQLWEDTLEIRPVSCDYRFKVVDVGVKNRMHSTLSVPSDYLFLRLSILDILSNSPRTLERELAKLRANCLGKKNSEIVLRFYRQLVAEGLGIARQIKYLSTLRRIASLLSKLFEEATKDDIIDFVAKIE